MSSDEARRQITAQMTGPGQPFEVVEESVFGRPMKVWKNAPATLRDLFVQGRAWGDLTYLVHHDDRISYAEHARAAATLARWLHDGRVRKGDRVGIAGSNSIDWGIAFWAAAAAGAVVVPLNSWGTGAELEYAIRDCGVSLLFADARRQSSLEGRLDGVAVVHLGNEGSGDRLRDIANREGSLELPEVAIDTDDDATIMYTSGTTGRPKGAVGTHRNITTNVMNLLFAGSLAGAVAQAVDPAIEIPAAAGQEGTLVTVPLFHATGCHATLVASMAQGAKLVLVDRFDPHAAVDLIERERLTRVMGVPTTVTAVLDAGIDRDLSSLTYLGFGGAPTPPSLPARIRQQLPGASFGVGYGLTESSANAATNIGADYEAHPDSVGTTPPIASVVAVDEMLNELPPGEIGELVIDGPLIVRGYWGREVETAETFPGGRLRTGDIGYVDAEGRVFLCDRLKDVVIRGGENVYCAEVEHVIASHPDVADAAVVGQPHQLLGEEVAAFVVPREGVSWDDDRTAELQAFVRERLAGFKVPSVVVVSQDPLERTVTGKLVKQSLRSKLAQQVGE